jgi:hypothetical protein
MDIYAALDLPANAEYIRSTTSEHISGLRQVLNQLDILDYTPPPPNKESSGAIMTLDDMLVHLRIAVDNRLTSSHSTTRTKRSVK